jgi:hypothetical protein
VAPVREEEGPRGGRAHDHLTTGKGTHTTLPLAATGAGAPAAARAGSRPRPGASVASHGKKG